MKRKTGRGFLKTTALTLGLAAAISVSFASTRGAADTLADALVGAYTHSGLLQQNRALLRAADEDVPIALSALRPIVNWSADLAQVVGDTTSESTGGVARSIDTTTISLELTASWQLYDFRADATRVEALKETVLATRATLLNIEQALLLRAASAFFNVGRQENFVSLSQNNLRLLQQELRAANDRFEVGEVTRTDVSLAEAAVAQARSNLADAQRNLIQAQAEYANVVGRQPGRLSGLPPLPRTETRIDTAQSVAVRNHPEMETARRQVSANELLVTAAAKDKLPVLSLSGRVSVDEEIGGDDSTEQASIGLNLTGPIYQGGRLSALERQAIANRDAARGNLHNVRHGVQQDVVNAISDFNAARASLAASERQIRAARIAFQGVREEATLGARTTLDVLDAEQNLLDAETNRISAQADQYIAAYAVLESMGLLTAQNLKLPVQIYDPSAYYNLVRNAPVKRSRQGRQLDQVLRALQVED
ncbi:TolC family outer membrane protein [Tateyamaria sp. ANG-S1]|uniref:TolC family outer membrane protein n=1 Tax=Tateyamaria sp. ANG-S1 TaxID=1577905 RepID=UPI0005803270|nr:TolC family outer membrane protein [Tateyamaria sp. ANG-S1]KIC50524.1 transporter [Tateyamaria sp. ANG-S1]